MHCTSIRPTPDSGGSATSGESSDNLDTPSGSGLRFGLGPVEHKEVLMIFSRLWKEKKASGPNGIPHQVLLRIQSFVIAPLTILINRCLEVGKYPTIFKSASVTPIPKINRPTSVDDFRPISLVCNLSKVFERVVQQQLVGFIKDNSILSDRQSGFRKGHSCETLLLKVTERWKRAIDTGNVIGADPTIRRIASSTSGSTSIATLTSNNIASI